MSHDTAPSSTPAVSRRTLVGRAGAGAALLAGGALAPAPTASAAADRGAVTPRASLLGLGDSAVERPAVAEQIAAFARRAQVSDFTAVGRDRTKMSILDSIGCALGALDAQPVQDIRRVIGELGDTPRTGGARLIGGGRAAVDRAALHNQAAVRYLDFMDNFASPGEVGHPSDCLGSVLTVADHVGASGRELLTAVGIAYQVQCRMFEEIPIVRAGLQNVVPVAFGVAAASARLLGLSAQTAPHAIALGGVDSLSLLNIQAEPVPNWKGLSSADAGSHAITNTFLARAGITGPLGLFEGPFGLYELVGIETNGFHWATERLDIGDRISIKRYDGEYQTQTAIETTLALAAEHDVKAGDVKAVSVEVPREAFDILGGGRYGPKSDPRVKEQADHNLKYVVAAALIDGQVRPPQYRTENVTRRDVQDLLDRVTVTPAEDLTARVPDQSPARITIQTDGGDSFVREQPSWHGFFASPMSWAEVSAKFDRLAQGRLNAGARRRVVAIVRDLEAHSTRELTSLLSWRPGTSCVLARPGTAGYAKPTPTARSSR